MPGALCSRRHALLEQRLVLRLERGPRRGKGWQRLRVRHPRFEPQPDGFLDEDVLPRRDGSREPREREREELEDGGVARLEQFAEVRVHNLGLRLVAGDGEVAEPLLDDVFRLGAERVAVVLEDFADGGDGVVGGGFVVPLAGARRLDHGVELHERGHELGGEARAAVLRGDTDAVRRRLAHVVVLVGARREHARKGAGEELLASRVALDDGVLEQVVHDAHRDAALGRVVGIDEGEGVGEEALDERNCVGAEGFEQRADAVRHLVQHLVVILVLLHEHLLILLREVLVRLTLLALLLALDRLLERVVQASHDAHQLCLLHEGAAR
mmetsp:Transcript_15112/g.49567  ORF Transcript_15112/g.49567 Transcript_15112/m.49567 type:complete len:326 (-) Transcript_15112:2395-3372(-)